MKICGRCVCALFGNMNCCLAYMPKGDKRMDRFITRTTECFVPDQYHENERTRLKRIALLTTEGDQVANN